MIRERRSDEPPRPWHVLLAPTIPILALVAPNASELEIRTTLWPMIVAVGGAALAWWVLARLSGNVRTAALAITILTVTVLSRQPIVTAAMRLGLPPVMVDVTVVLICVSILRTARLAAGATNFANALVSMLVLVFTAQIVWTEVRRSVVHAPAAAFPASSTTQRPDVYVLVLDGYGRADVLRDLYGFENEVAGNLQALGFFVAEQAASNYAQTTLSLASSLNFDYVPSLLEGVREQRNRRMLSDLINGNRMFATFRAAGYRVRAYQSEYGLIRPQADERLGPPVRITDFAFAFYEGTGFAPLFRTLGLPPSRITHRIHRRQVYWTLDHLAQGVDDATDRPTLVFAHILAPHPPFIFNPDGSDRWTMLPGSLSDGDHWHIGAEGSGERYRDGYVAAVRFINYRVLEIVRRLLNRQRPAIVLIHGDHGPGSALHWEDPEATDMRERFGILLAVRFPDSDYRTMHAGVSPVNASRAVLNRAIGTTFPAVPDRSYFSTWSRPFDLIDITGRARPTP